MQSRTDGKTACTECSDVELRKSPASGTIEHHLTSLAGCVADDIFHFCIVEIDRSQPALSDRHIAYYPKRHLVVNPFPFHPG